MNVYIAVYFLLISTLGEINFSHMPQYKLQLSDKEQSKLRKSGTYDNIKDAVVSVGEALPDNVLQIFSKAKECIESNPIKGSAFYSYTTLYGAYNDLINHCVAIEYNKLNQTKIDSDQMFLIFYDWSDGVSSYVFDVKRDSQPLLDEYIRRMTCDSTINYHLFISSIMAKIKIKDFDSIKFLNYLFH